MTRQPDDRHRWTDPRTRATDSIATGESAPTSSVTMTSPDQVSVVSGGVTVAQADVVPGPQVVLRFWVAGHSLTPETRRELVRTAFAHDALVPRQRVLATVPQAENDLVAELHNHVTVTSTHVAGATCLVEGHVT
jgi:hypothetical protein